MEYGDVVMAFDPHKLDKTFRRVPKSENPDTLLRLKLEYPTMLEVDDDLWFSRLPPGNGRTGTTYESFYTYFIPGEPREALLLLFLIGDDADALRAEFRRCGVSPPALVPMDATNDETLEFLWSYCTAEKRLVPKPTWWSELYSKLRYTREKPSGGWEPPPPLILAAWHHSMPIEKQLRFKVHLEWATQQGQLAEIAVFLRSLTEEQWCHFGDL